ncbi:MAG: acetylglutamate kinase [Bacteroidales bacterium]|nr:acetylglutamate kinase [Bacteroidales bacterium]
MKKQTILFKYGGNAMTNTLLKKQVLKNILSLKKKGFNVIISHGGGPFIKNILEQVGVESEFIDGQRVTTPEAFKYIEMALKGQVNSDLVNTINTLGGKAVGLSGNDGQTVTAEKRLHKRVVDGKEEIVDLGQVGNIAKVDRTLIDVLFDNDYIPVIACIASDENGVGYNINGDSFAGTIAGAINVEQFIVLTDVDGLLMNKDNPDSIIRSLNFYKIKKLKSDGIIQGGMIPKIEACENAIIAGAKSAKIINGKKPDQILSIDEDKFGTLIRK